MSDVNPGAELWRLYRERFSGEELAFKRRVWKVLCRDFFQRYVRTSDTVLDLGAGSCEFINAIRAERRIAVDVSPDLRLHAQGAEVVHAPSTDLAPVADGSVDVVFASNLFEHLPDKTAVLATLEECRRILRPGGTLILLQPNIRYLPGRYWDYFDHYTPLTHLSMAEALRLVGFEPREIVPRFLPYSVKQSRLPKPMFLVRLYLRFRVLWPVFGRQMLIVASRRPR